MNESEFGEIGKRQAKSVASSKKNNTRMLAEVA
jgi:hypothetical protein